jgi:hypothetical protein
LFDRAFLTLSRAYKKYFEAGPVDRLKGIVPRQSVFGDVRADAGSLRLADVSAALETPYRRPEDRCRVMVSQIQSRGKILRKIPARPPQKDRDLRFLFWNAPPQLAGNP